MANRMILAALLALLSCLSCGRRDDGGGKIALLLPETKTSRYETQDLPLFKARLKALGFDADRQLLYANANQDAAEQLRQAEAALANGAKVLVLDPVDSDAAAAIAELAKRNRTPVIAYDRMVNGSDGVVCHISFDNERVGRLQGEALLQALAAAGKGPSPAVVMINGSPTDNNARQFKKGAHAALDGKARLVMEYDTPDWSPDKARDQMSQALTALANRLDGVYCANDGTAGGAIAAMKGAGLSPLPPVTGQDAELAAVQRILAGEQYMTVYKPIRLEAEAAAETAFALFRGKSLPPDRFQARIDNGAAAVPALLIEPIVVTRDKVKATIVHDGFWKPADLRKGGYAQFCDQAGIR